MVIPNPVQVGNGKGLIHRRRYFNRYDDEGHPEGWWFSRLHGQSPASINEADKGSPKRVLFDARTMVAHHYKDGKQDQACWIQNPKGSPYWYGYGIRVNFVGEDGQLRVGKSPPPIRCLVSLSGWWVFKGYDGTNNQYDMITEGVLDLGIPCLYWNIYDANGAHKTCKFQDVVDKKPLRVVSKSIFKDNQQHLVKDLKDQIMKDMMKERMGGSKPALFPPPRSHDPFQHFDIESIIDFLE